MAIVKRANVILTVNDALVQQYLDKGYCEVDSHGDVIHDSTPKDYASLKYHYDRVMAENAELKAQNGELQKEIAALKATKKTKTKVVAE